MARSSKSFWRISSLFDQSVLFHNSHSHKTRKHKTAASRNNIIIMKLFLATILLAHLASLVAGGLIAPDDFDLPVRMTTTLVLLPFFKHPL